MSGPRPYHPSEHYQDPSASSSHLQHPTSHNDYDYQVDYDSQHPSYPPPPVSNYNSAYATDYKPPIDDYPPKAEPLYPPTNVHAPYPFVGHQSQSSAPSLRPSIATGISTTPSKQTFTSTMDLDGEDGDYSKRAAPNIKTTDTETGWKAALWPNSKACRAYLLTVLLETIVDVAIEGGILVELDSMQESVSTPAGVTQSRQPVYLGLFVLAHVLQMVLAVDAVYNKNTLQFAFLAVFNFSLLIYGAVQIVEVKDNLDQLAAAGVTAVLPVRVMTILVPIAVAIAEIVYIGLGYQIWKEFGWKVYKFLGADRTIKKVYANYQVFQCLLKFDIFFWVGFSLQWVVLVLADDDFEWYATIVALPLSILLLIEGYLAARHENKWMMASFMVGCVAGCAYFIYKAFKILQQKNKGEFEHLWKSLLIFAVLSIILLVITFVLATVVMANFDRGLKESLNKRGQESKLERKGTYKPGAKGAPAHYPGINPKRMSIE